MALHAGPANADDVQRLEPSSPWNINYADDSCRLSRRFGEGDDETYLIFDRFAPGDRFRMTVIGRLLQGARAGRAAIIRFGTEAEQELGFVEATTNDVPTLIVSSMRVAPYTDEERARYDALSFDESFLFEVDPIAPERIAAINEVFVDGYRFDPILFETGSLRDPFAAFDTCIDELLTHWGIDVGRHANLSREVRPTGSPGRWLVSSDYPRGLLRRGSQGLVHFRLSVDASGRPTDCHIQQSTRPPGFDEVVCDRLMERAEFEPALDEAGEPLASFYTNTVRFQIPY